MPEIRFTVPGLPIAKARPKFARIGNGVRTYSTQGGQEKTFASLVIESLGSPPTPAPPKVPVEMELLFVMPRPGYHFGTGKNAGRLKDNAPEVHTVKPDLDNLEKFVKDSLNKVLWHDDAQVCEVSKRKVYGDKPAVNGIVRW